MINTRSHHPRRPGAPVLDPDVPRHLIAVPVLIVVNVLLAAVGWVLIALAGQLSVAGVLSNGISPVQEWGEMHGPSVDRGDYWRLVSASVLHYGAVHLGVNMLLLWLAGSRLERLVGPGRFLVLYALSASASGVAIYYLDHDAFTAGASGAVFGVFAALLVVCLRAGLGIWWPAVLVMLGLLVTFVVPGMAVAAHLGGLVVGAVVAAGYTLSGADRHSLVRHAVPAAVLILLVVLTAMAPVLAG